MQPVRSRPPPPTRPTGKGWNKLLVGCVVLFGLAVVAVVALGILGGAWMLTPGRQADPEEVLGAHSDGIFRLDDPAGDPGLRALVARFLVEAQRVEDRRAAGSLPESVRWLEGFQRGQRAQSAHQASAFMSWLLPREAVLSFERQPDDDEAHPLFVANFRRFVRPVRWLVEKLAEDDPRTETRSYRGRELLLFDDGPAVTFAGGTLLVADEAATLERALDRLAEPGAGTRPPLLAELGEAGQWDASGVAVEPVAVRSAARVLGLGGPEQPAVRDAESLRFAFDVETAEVLRGEVVFGYADPETAREAASALEAQLAELADRWSARGLSLAAELSVAGSRVTSTVRLTGLGAAVASWVEEVEQDAAEEEGEPVEGEVFEEVEEDPEAGR